MGLDQEGPGGPVWGKVLRALSGSTRCSAKEAYALVVDDENPAPFSFDEFQRLLDRMWRAGHLSRFVPANGIPLYSNATQ
jgi:hypothetical protein